MLVRIECVRRLRQSVVRGTLQLGEGGVGVAAYREQLSEPLRGLGGGDTKLLAVPQVAFGRVEVAELHERDADPEP